MARLLTESRLSDPDSAYDALVAAHRGLSERESAELNARLVLILANHIGEEAVLAEALALARQARAPSARCGEKAYPPPESEPKPPES
jgi:hypothetical protein